MLGGWDVEPLLRRLRRTPVGSRQDLLPGDPGHPASPTLSPLPSIVLFSEEVGGHRLGAGCLPGEQAGGAEGHRGTPATGFPLQPA